MNKLAIVIPAYKPDFLEKSLQSLASQKDQRFSVYVGIDASPYSLEGIIEPFKERLDLKIHRFNDNLGGTNLVGQWERCISLCQDEEWICLFSDDDVMQPNCVASFYQSIIPEDINVLHFDIEIIDETDSVLQVCPAFPRRIDNASYFDLLFRRKLVARMPEFIFRKSFLCKNGIVPFDMAWRSDTATILSAARSGGIWTLAGNNNKVLWRASTKNISGQSSLKKRKNKANIAFFNWVYGQDFSIKMSTFHLLKTIVFSLEYDSAWQFYLDGCRAIVRLKFAKWHRLLCFLFIHYRIPYHWVETHRT